MSVDKKYDQMLKGLKIDIKNQKYPVPADYVEKPEGGSLDR